MSVGQAALGEHDIAATGHEKTGLVLIEQAQAHLGNGPVGTHMQGRHGTVVAVQKLKAEDIAKVCAEVDTVRVDRAGLGCAALSERGWGG